MEWQILTTFFSIITLVLVIVILMAQTVVRNAQIAQADALMQLLATSTSSLSIIREMDKQQDLFVKQMPPSKMPSTCVAEMDSNDLPDGMTWVNNVPAILPEVLPKTSERFRVAARQALQKHSEEKEKAPTPKRRGRKPGTKVGPYTKKVKL